MSALLAIAICWLVGALLVVAGERLAPHWRRRLALAAVLSGLLLVWTLPSEAELLLFAASLRVDMLALLVLTVAMLAGLAGLLLEQATASFAGREGLLLMALAGAGGCALAADLVFLLAGVTLAGLPVFVAAIAGGEAGREGALKALLVFLLAIALGGLGAALVLARVGSTSFAALAAFWREHPPAGEPLLQTAIMLWLAAAAALAAVFPAHMWLVDLVECQETSASAVLGAGVLTALLAAAARLWLSALAPAGAEAAWVPAFKWLGLLSLWAGLLAALVQKNSRRFVALLAVSQNGLFLLGLAAIAGRTAEVTDAASACGVLLVAQALAWLAMLLDLPPSAAASAGSDMRLTRHGWVFGLALLWAAGLPPLPGFWARLHLLRALAQSGEEIVALLTVLAMGMLLAGCLWRLRGGRGAYLPDNSPFWPRRLLAVIIVCLMLGLSLLPAGIFELARSACALPF